MERNLSKVTLTAHELMRKEAEIIIELLVKQVPKNNLGYLCVNFGMIYSDICKKLHVMYGESLEKQDFDKFMNDYFGKDERIFLRAPLELPCKEREVLNYIIVVYFNNLGELSSEVVDAYIEKFVKDYLIFPLRALSEDSFHYMYSSDGEIIDKDLFALQHFAGYGEKEMDEIFKKMQDIAKKYNCTLDLVPESEIYSRTLFEDRLHIMIKREAQ